MVHDGFRLAFVCDIQGDIMTEVTKIVFSYNLVTCIAVGQSLEPFCVKHVYEEVHGIFVRYRVSFLFQDQDNAAEMYEWQEVER